MLRRFNYRKILLLLVLAVLVVYRDLVVASLLPFVLAFILAAMIEPIVAFLQHRARLPRAVAAFASLFVLIVLPGYLVTLVMAIVATELVDLASRLPTYQRELARLTDELIGRLNDLYEYLPPQVSTYLQAAIDDASRSAIVLAADLIDRSLRAISGLPSLLVVLIVTLLATYFLSKDREPLTEALFRLAPQRWQLPLRQAQEKIVVDLIGFLKAQVVIFIMTTSVAAVGLYYVGTRFWMTLAIILGVLDVIPVVGPGFVLFPWAAVSLAMDRLDLAVQLCLIFVAILAVRQTAQAKVIGDSIGVHPLAMLVALYGGIVVFGVRGMIIGPLLVIVGKALVNSGLLSPFLIAEPSTEPQPSRAGEKQGSEPLEEDPERRR